MKEKENLKTRHKSKHFLNKKRGKMFKCKLDYKTRKQSVDVET